MKRSKRISAVLCAALLLATAGCGTGAGGTASGAGITDLSGTGASQGAMGRWVEEKIDIDKPYVLLCAPVALANGTLRMYARDVVDQETMLAQGSTLHQLDSTDGGLTWQETPSKINETDIDYVSDLHVSPNGGVLMIGMLLSEEENERRFAIYYAAPEGAPVPVPFDGASPLLQNDPSNSEGASGMITAIPPLFEGQPQLSSIGFLSDTLAYGKIIPTGSSEAGEETSLDITILFEPATGKIVAKADTGKGYSSSNLSAPAAYANGMLHMSYEEDGSRSLYSVDAAGSSTLLLKGIQSYYTPAGYADAAGNYYFINAAGIYSIAVGGTLAELMVDGAGLSFSSENKMIFEHGFTRMEDGSFFVTQQLNMDVPSELFRYRFDTTLPSVNANSIHVWSLEENATLRAALVEFRKIQPELTVNYTVGMSAGAEGLNPEDVLRALNTQILAGTGPDVLVLDGMDAASYVNKGLLLDLSAQVDGDALVPFVKQSYYKVGETFVLPARFSVPVVAGPADKMGAISTLQGLQEAILACPARPAIDGESDLYYAPMKAEEMYGMGFPSIDSLVDFALQASATALMVDGKVNADALAQLMGFIDAVGKHSDMGNYPLTFSRTGATGSGESDAVTWLDGGYEFSATGNAVYGWDAITTPAYLAATTQLDRATQTKRPIGFVVQPGLVSGAYLPRTLMAVSAGSKQREAALAFVQAILGQQVQSGFYQDGMPVLQKELDASITRNSNAKSLEKSNIKTDPAALLASLQTPVVVDTMVQEKISSHALTMLQGKETLEQAVAAIETELGLYLAERG